MNRRWHPGQTVEISGVTFRVVQGRKGPADLRLEWLTSSGSWRPVDMAAGGLMADFFYENESYLYPDHKGGRKYLDYLREAAQFGWDKAQATLRLEKLVKGAQPTMFGKDTA